MLSAFIFIFFLFYFFLYIMLYDLFFGPVAGFHIVIDLVPTIKAKPSHTKTHYYEGFCGIRDWERK